MSTPKYKRIFLLKCSMVITLYDRTPCGIFEIFAFYRSNKNTEIKVVEAECCKRIFLTSFAPLMRFSSLEQHCQNLQPRSGWPIDSALQKSLQLIRAIPAMPHPSMLQCMIFWCYWEAIIPEGTRYGARGQNW
jgi:hypothetical protein